RPDAAESAAALAPGARPVPLGAVVAPPGPSPAAEAVDPAALAAPPGPSSAARVVDPGGFSVVVNATPLGMSGGDPLPVDPEALHAGQAVVDLVYHPADTPLLTAARLRGALAVNGLGMLLHQAAR